VSRDKHSRRDERGASAVEYGLLVAAIAAVIITVVFVVGKFVKGEFDQTCAEFNTQPVGGVTQTCP
jgi:pilus assembly protein Flp/PilA